MRSSIVNVLIIIQSKAIIHKTVEDGSNTKHATYTGQTTVNTKHVTTKHVTTQHVTTKHVTTKHVTTKHLTTKHLTTNKVKHKILTHLSKLEIFAVQGALHTERAIVTVTSLLGVTYTFYVLLLRGLLLVVLAGNVRYLQMYWSV